MTAPAILIDFGSTFTKVAAVDLDAARILGRAQAPSTVTSDVAEGLFDALAKLADHVPALADRVRGLDDLASFHVRASSSAAGGLRIVVIGLVPGLTVQAAGAAALGAGAKVVGTFAFKLTADDMAAIGALKPDMILLTGGTDGGDAATILHNARMLAGGGPAAPVVIAGNADARAEAGKILAGSGNPVIGTDNVMPAAGAIHAAPAQEQIRSLFMRRITDAKGLDRVKSRVPVVLPTPLAVQKAAVLGARGTAPRGGCGELMVVDVGGATTDVYSIGEGRPRGRDLIPAGLPEPFEKRTVEGDLGIRYNARTIVERAGADALHAAFEGAFPLLAVDRDHFLGYVAEISDATGTLPDNAWQTAADATLARAAVDIAFERHVGRADPYYSSGGTVALINGKDMRDCPLVIGTGGIFVSNPHAEWILSAPSSTGERARVLRPAAPRVLIDRDYALYAIGLLADDFPDVAFELFHAHFSAARPDHAHHYHQELAGAGGDPCCE